MNVREAVFQWLREREIRVVFGNPGSTELPFLVGFPEDVRYVLGLQESVVLAMADGYAQASGRPALVNLHVAPGLGHAVGSLYTARKNRSPVVVTAGQQDTRHLLLEPLLAGDLVAMARPLVKWAHQVAHAADVPAALEQAYLLAAAPPPGPTFVAIPSNYWDAPGEPVAPRQLVPPGLPQGLSRLAEALAQAANPALVIGSGVDWAGAWDAAVRLAEALGSPVFSDPIGSRIGFPTDHPLFQGMLAPAKPRIAQALSGHDVVLVAGAPVFLLYLYFPGPLVPPGVRVYLLTDDPEEAARAPAVEAYVGDVGEALAWLAERVPPRGKPLPSRVADAARQRTEAARARARMGVPFVLHTLARLLPPEAVTVDESVSSSLALREYVPIRRPGGYFTAASGGLGWGLPAAVGIQLAWPERPVVAVVGDGSAMYGIQALWTAAREQAPVRVVVLNNGGYSILKSYARAFYPGLAERVPGLDLPGLDLVAVARGLGVPGERVEDPEALEPALERALAAEGPYLLDVQIDRTVPNLFG